MLSQLTDREQQIWHIVENKHRYDQLPWQWDPTYEDDMYGMWYQEDFNCYKQVCELIQESIKDKRNDAHGVG